MITIKLTFPQALEAYKKGKKVGVFVGGKLIPLNQIAFYQTSAPKSKNGKRSPDSFTIERMQNMYADGYSYRQIAEELGYSYPTVWKYVNKDDKA